MSIIKKLEEMGFLRGLHWTHTGSRYEITEDSASNLRPPLVYVIVDKNGLPVRRGRSLRQTIRQREGSTAKAMNGESTEGQNNKSVVRGLRQEVKDNGPLASWVLQAKDDAAATAAEALLGELFWGRLDKR